MPPVTLRRYGGLWFNCPPQMYDKRELNSIRLRRMEMRL